MGKGEEIPPTLLMIITQSPIGSKYGLGAYSGHCGCGGFGRVACPGRPAIPGGQEEMKLSPRKGGHGHITAYMAVIGSKEARQAGFLREDGSSRILRKVVDQEKGTITLIVDWDNEPGPEGENAGVP